MKRQEILKKLEELIPSFKMEFIDEEFFGKLGWLYVDEYRSKPPAVIPPHFLEGIQIKRKDGSIGTTIRVDTVPEMLDIKKREGEFTDRMVRFSYMNFPGYSHLYGKLEIQGVELVIRKDDGEYLFTGISKWDIPEDHPELEQASYYWKTTLGRIVTQQDLDDRRVDWDGYDLGSRTNRFTSLKELRQTAVYVALLRVQGAFYMEDDHVLGEQKHRIMFRVDENDEVTFYNNTEQALFPF